MRILGLRDVSVQQRLRDGLLTAIASILSRCFWRCFFISAWTPACTHLGVQMVRNELCVAGRVIDAHGAHLRDGTQALAAAQPYLLR